MGAHLHGLAQHADVVVLQLSFHVPCSVHVMATMSATMTVQELLQLLLMMKILQMNDICMCTVQDLIIHLLT